MKMKLFSIGLALTLGTGYTLTAYSQSQSPNAMVNARRGAMYLQHKYFAPALAMVQDRAPYDAATMQRNADYLAVLTQLPWDDFQPSTIGNANTKAKEDVYKDAVKFKAASDDLKAEVQKFVTAARGGDRAAVGTAVRAVARNCNSCHEAATTINFRYKVD